MFSLLIWHTRHRTCNIQANNNIHECKRSMLQALTVIQSASQPFTSIRFISFIEHQLHRDLRIAKHFVNQFAISIKMNWLVNECGCPDIPVPLPICKHYILIYTILFRIYKKKCRRKWAICISNSSWYLNADVKSYDDQTIAQLVNW